MCVDRLEKADSLFCHAVHAHLRLEPVGPPKFLTALLSIHAPFSDPGRPSGILPVTTPLCWLPSHSQRRHLLYPLFRGSMYFREVRPPLRPVWFPVYASCALFDATHGFMADSGPPTAHCPLSTRVGAHAAMDSYLLRTRNTRYGWVANPYPTGTLTQQEAPGLAWRTNEPRLCEDYCRRHCILS